MDNPALSTVSGILSAVILRNTSKNLDSTAFSSVTGEMKNDTNLDMGKDKAVIQQVLSLPDKSIDELQALWKALFNADPPKHSKAYLIPRLAYRLQELVYGPLEDEYVKQLDQMADDLERGKKPKSKYLLNKPRNGTKLIREYQGQMHEVLVTEDGYVYKGQPYKSLSVIARKITGTQWSGPKFWGLK